MSRVLYRVGAAFGRADLVAVGIGALSLTVLLFQALPLGRDNAVLKQQVTALSTSAPAGQTDRLSQQRHFDVQEFLRALPSDQQRAEDIAQFSVLARNHGLQIDQMDFQEVGRQASDSPLNSLLGRITAEGTYSSTRNFLNDAWVKMPNLAISSIRLTRPAAAGNKVQAKLEFVYYSSLSTTERASASPAPIRSRHLPVEAVPTANPFEPSLAVRPPAPPKREENDPPLLPLAYGGSYRSAGGEFHLLLEGDIVYRVRVGETLPNGQFRLDSADRYQVELVHLPSSRRYPLPTGNVPQ